MPGSTTNYAFNLPLVNDPIDADLWGGQLNANWTSVDALLAAAGIKTGGGLEPTDSLFRIVDNADATKKLAFEVSGITAGNTRTLTVTDRSLAIPANAAGPSSLVLAEDTDNGSHTATITAPAALTANRTYTLPDEDGTMVTTARVASSTVQGIVELATKAETESASSTSLVAALDQLHNHPGVAKAWASFNGTTGSVLSSYGVTSVTRNSAGIYTVVLSRTMASANYAITINCSQTLGSANTAQVSRGTTPTSTGFVIDSFNTNSGTRTDSDLVYFAVFGTLA